MHGQNWKYDDFRTWLLAFIMLQYVILHTQILYSIHLYPSPVFLAVTQK
jgi:hypothetical protein